MFKFNIFSLLARGIAFLIIGITLAGCDLDTLLSDASFKGMMAGDPASVRAVQTRLQKGSAEAEAIFYSAFEEDSIYLPDDYVEEITKDRVSLMTKLIGPAIWRNGYTYSDVAKYNIDGLDEATFNYIKGTGGAWIMSLRNDPKNAFVTERKTLYNIRVGDNALQEEQAINPMSLRRLLRDDEALSMFLTDDNYAGAWLSRNPVWSWLGAAKKTYPSNFIPSLGPATSGVLPNASP